MTHSALFKRLTRPLREWRWRKSGWSAADDKQFHDTLFTPGAGNGLTRGALVRQLEETLTAHATGLARKPMAGLDLANS